MLSKAGYAKLVKHLNILGIRGVPAAHGGFETFAHNFSVWLTEQGWTVNVYCQHDDTEVSAPADGYEDKWNGVNRIHYRIPGSGPLSTIKFDLRCAVDVCKRPGIDLVLGYNTAVFNLIQRLRGRKVVMNMDGVEWRRQKWGAIAKMWFYFNEFIGCRTSSAAIADHPEIAQHLRRHGCDDAIVIPYGSPSIVNADSSTLEKFDLTPRGYLISIARVEPENSIFEIVKAFSSRRRSIKMVVLGSINDDNNYHRRVKDVASDDVIFLGAIYDKKIVEALRSHALAYVHGHQVGGTNPSLVEALGSQNAVIAHDNRFNRWVAGNEQFYFGGIEELIGIFNTVETDQNLFARARIAAKKRHSEDFTLEMVHNKYLDVLERFPG